MRRLGECLEIHVTGQVCGARRIERVNRLVLTQSLKGVSERTPIAVVDDKGRAAVLCYACADRAGNRLANASHLNKVAVPRVLDPVCQAFERHRLSQSEHECVAVQPNHTLMPTRAIPDKLTNGQRIEELVRNQKHRSDRNLVQQVMERDVRTDRFNLFSAQDR